MVEWLNVVWNLKAWAISGHVRRRTYWTMRTMRCRTREPRNSKIPATNSEVNPVLVSESMLNLREFACRSFLFPFLVLSLFRLFLFEVSNTTWFKVESLRLPNTPLPGARTRTMTHWHYNLVLRAVELQLHSIRDSEAISKYPTNERAKTKTIYQ